MRARCLCACQHSRFELFLGGHRPKGRRARGSSSMRGSPILRAFATLLVLLALAYPLHQLLRPEVTAATPGAPLPAAKPVQAKGVHLQMSFTQAPRKMRVLSLGEPVWEVESPAGEVEKDLPIAYPPEGVDLQFELEWPEGVRAAARARLTDPEGVEHTGFIWGQGATTDVVVFH